MKRNTQTKKWINSVSAQSARRSNQRSRRVRAELVLKTVFVGKRQERTFQLGEILWEKTQKEDYRGHTLETVSGPTWLGKSSERRLESYNHAMEGLNLAWTCALLYRPWKALKVPKHDCNKWKQCLRTITLAVGHARATVEVAMKKSAWARVIAMGKKSNDT